jgi:hypothetical protein
LAAARYSKAQLEAIWIKAGGSRAAAPLAAAVALAESGGSPDATHVNSDGSIDRGLWQVNSVHGAQSTTDPMANARAAVNISSGGQNWHPWVTFNTGAYRKYLSGSVAPATSLPAGTGAATAIGDSGDGGQLFDDTKASQVKYAAVWIVVAAGGLALAWQGLNRTAAGAPNRIAKRAASAGARTAAKAAAAA